MAFLDTVNRYFAYRLKEIELRVNAWKRAREISRAYDTRPSGRVSGGRGPNFGNIKPFAAKAAKVSAIAAGVALIVFGVIAGIRHIPLSMDHANGGSADTSGDAFAETPPKRIEVPAGAELPEAAVLPEGFAEPFAAADTAGGAAGAQAAPPPAAPQPVPRGRGDLASTFRTGMPRGLAERLILVDKAAKVMYIFKSMSSGWEIEKSYPVATGERDGRKQVEGDKKTPTGVYFIVGRKHNSELTNIYGPAAFILDYPNEDDRREGRTGHGIWVHGSERGNIPPLFTQGCVAVANQDILEIAGLLRDWAGTPVVIVSGSEDAKKHLAEVDFPKLKARGEEVASYHNRKQAEFENLVLGWKSAWESRNIEAYSAFYSASSFQDGPKKWDTFRDHKANMFALWSTITVDVSGIALT
jgi:hypothetical protein